MKLSTSITGLWLVLSVGLIWAAGVQATEIIVTTSGTIQSALDMAQPGDIVTVRDGVYYEKISFPRSGDAAGGQITLRAYPGENPILDGQGQSGQFMILIDGKSYLRITGLEIRNNTGLTDGSGIRLLGACQNIEILSNVIHDMRGTNAMAITVYGTASEPATNITIRGNHVYDCEPATSETIVLNGNVMGFDVSSNRVHDVNNIGIDFIGGEAEISAVGVCRNGVCRGNQVYRVRSSYEDGYAAGIYVDGALDIVVEHNWIYECDVGLEIGAENAGLVVTGVVVRANLIFNNDKAGLGFGGYDETRGRVQHCRFVNNLCYKNDTLQTGNGELWIQWASSNVVENNIFYSGPQNRLLNSPCGNYDNQLDYNLWFNDNGLPNSLFVWNGVEYSDFAGYRAGTAQDAHSLFTNPSLINPADTNFHVASTSVVVNAGTPNYVPSSGETDLDGMPRVSDLF